MEEHALKAFADYHSTTRSDRGHGRSRGKGRGRGNNYRGYQNNDRGDDAQLIHADFDGENEDDWQQPMEQVQNEQQLVESTNECPQRAKRRPAWMENFVIKGIDEEQLTNFALFLDCDPVTFEEAVK
ncbi:hypothetical protein V6N12_045417 [Hibiscus sabdariffa]|uniref:Uncharacterized protein n=1 Tax=Hibiscus sabdariffa TaxID=183260 RepID=A0ABR2G3L4_9ROSI